MHNMCKYMCVRFIYVMNTVFDIHVQVQYMGRPALCRPVETNGNSI